MTNETLLRNAIARNGMKIKFVAERIELSYQGFLNKMTGKSEFNAKEIVNLCKLLHIERHERDNIFFAKEVDETSSRKGDNDENY